MNELIEKYIEELNIPINTEYLETLKTECQKEQIPIVDKEVGQFLYLITLIKKPKKILEIGFGGGYSTLWIHLGSTNESKIISLDLNKYRVEAGKKYLNKLSEKSIPDINNMIDIKYCDALNFLKEIDDKFDLIFLDAVKRTYIHYLELIIPKLNKDGLLIVDNILFRGRVVSDNLEKRYISGVKLLKDFNKNLSDNKLLKTYFLPIGDGVSLSVKL